MKTLSLCLNSFDQRNIASGSAGVVTSCRLPGLFGAKSMTKVVLNPFLSELHGGKGDMVFKTFKRGNKVVVVMTRRPRMENVIWSEKQEANRDRMRRAGEFYRTVVADEAVLALYRAVAQKKGISVPALTQRDFFRAPEIVDFDVRGYSGQRGDSLNLTVTDPLEAYQAIFSVRTEAGEVRESGKGKLNPLSNTQFVYTTASAVAPGETVVLEVVVTDRPGNVKVASVKWTNMATTTPLVAVPKATANSKPSYGEEDVRAG
jgi:hypothetical protein